MMSLDSSLSPARVGAATATVCTVASDGGLGRRVGTVVTVRTVMAVTSDDSHLHQELVVISPGGPNYHDEELPYKRIWPC